MSAAPSPPVPPRHAARTAGEAAAVAALQDGVQFLQRKEWQAAEECFERARQGAPHSPIPLNCLGIVARSTGRWEAAQACFRQVIAMHPRFAEAHNNLGNVLRDLGDLAQAAASYRQALTFLPDFPEARNNLGVALLALGDAAGAVENLERAIELVPTYAAAHNNLATAYLRNGDPIGAAASLQTALQLQPQSPEIHLNLGNVLRDSGQYDSAEHHYRQALRLDPNFAEAYDNWGTLLLDREQLSEALGAYERAAALRPDHASFQLNLGNAYRLAGRTSEARRAYTRLAEREPAQPWHRLRIAALCPPAFSSHEELLRCRREAEQSWRQFAQSQAGRGPLPLDSSLAEPAFAWQFLEGNLRPLKEAYAAIFAGGWPEGRKTAGTTPPRIGIVVTRGHEGLFLRSLAGVLQRIRQRHFQLVVICPAPAEAQIRQGLGDKVELLPVPTDFQLMKQAIAEHGFAALYYWEIGTDATNYFLPFFRLAPRQCTSWGVQVTSGNRCIDEYWSSEQVEPPDAADHYTERLVLAPSLLTYQIPPMLPPRPVGRDAFGVSDHQHLYVCAQQLGKFHPDFDAWIGEILRQDAAGIFLAVSDRSGHAASIVHDRLRRNVPDVAQRIVFLPRLSFADYLQLLHAADVLLDPPHFGGVNSSYDALAVGQPIVTLPSGYHRGRYTAACLRRVDAGETIAAHSADYIQKAVTLAGDRDRRIALRERIQRNAPQLFRDEAAVRDHERLFEQLISQANEQS